MKKLILIISLIFILSSCFESNTQSIEEAKKNMNIISSIDNSGSILTSENEINEDDNSINEIKNEETYKIEYLTSDKFIELNSLDGKDFKSGEIQITGKTLVNVDKIQVSFSNSTSLFPFDNYVLQQFKAGDSSFEYNASSKNQVLDFGKNEYIFTAFSGEKNSKLKLTVFIDDEKETVYEAKNIGTEDNVVYTNFPKNDVFGELLLTGEDSFTYSKIDNLNVLKESISGLMCDNVNEFLSNRINSWYFWNTCRDIVKEKGISYYVIRILENDNYVYEKHYIDLIHGFYGTYEIEKGIGVTKDNISEKNNELKEKNENYENVKIVDDLFVKIVNS